MRHFYLPTWHSTSLLVVLGCAGALLAVASRLHSGSCRFFTKTRPTPVLQYVRRSAHETRHLNICRAVQSVPGRHMAILAGRTEQGAAASRKNQNRSRQAASNLSSAAPSSDSGSAQDTGLVPELGKRLFSALTAATLALAILFSSTPIAYAAAFPFAPRVSSTPATLEMKVKMSQGMPYHNCASQLSLPGSPCHIVLFEIGQSSGCASLKRRFA